MAGAAPAAPSPTDESDLQELLRMVETAPTGEEWTVLSDQANLKIYRSRQPKTKYRFRLEVKLDNSALFCFKITTDERYWVPRDGGVTGFPSLVKEAKEVEVIDDYTRILYVLVRGIWPVGDRDMVLKMHRRILSDGRMVAVGRSVTHPAYPQPPRGVSRVTSEVSGAVFSPLEDGSDACWIKQVYDGDPQGWIPEHLISLGCSKVAPHALWVINRLISSPKARKMSKGVSTRSKGLPPVPTSGSTPAPDAAPANSERVQVPTPIVRSRAEGVNPSARYLGSGRAPGEAVRAAAPPRPLTLFGRISAAIEWARPFIIAFLYFYTLFRFFRRRRAARV